MPRILNTENGVALQQYEGKRVIPIDNASGQYREWLVTIDTTNYCVVNEGDTWILMHQSTYDQEWYDDIASVQAFLDTHNLILST